MALLVDKLRFSVLRDSDGRRSIEVSRARRLLRIVMQITEKQIEFGHSMRL